MRMRYLCIAAVALVTLGGCENLTPTQNRLAGGTLAGATGGAVLGAIAGNAALGTAIGAGVGLAGGAIYNHIKQNEQTQ
ncbi:MAG: glycine zipper domain-containing protein [Acetobacteraceae bacterium]